MARFVILIIAFILDGLLTNFLPYGVGHLTLFTPLFCVVSIFLIYPFYYKKHKEYFITAFILGILYDLFYTNLLFYNGLVFLLMAFIASKLYNNFEVNNLNIILFTIIMVVIYEVIGASIILVFNLVPMSFSRLLYKIDHTLILNIIYAEIVYTIIRMLPNKYKKIRIN
jgi:rod shape-determining protein MreD